jgi:CTP:molybdopterin cytidylyltransferase MocA
MAKRGSHVIAVAILAAGRGVRFGGDVPKPLLPFAGAPLVTYALAAATGSGLHPVLCVVSDNRVAAALPSGVEVVRNDAPEQGIASSLHAAVRVLAPRADVDAVVVGLADQPLVGTDAYRRVAAACDAGARLAVATYAGVRGNPVLIARALWSEALELAGDEGARVLLRRHGAAEVPCDGTGEPTDVDTPEDLAALESTWKSQTASE